MILLCYLQQGAANIDEDFSFFQPLDLISKDVKELQVMLRERKREERHKDKDRERSKENDKEVERGHDGDRSKSASLNEKHGENEIREGKGSCKSAWRW